jgi:hypothetical protein
MRNVGHAEEEARFGAIVAAAPPSSWVDDMPVAAAIEARLWAAYEARFNEQHLRSLAYRYEPRTDEERAVVLRFFPPVVFALGKGRTITVRYDALHADADGGLTIGWDAVRKMVFKDGTFGKTLVVTCAEPGAAKTVERKIKLRGLGKQEAALKAVLGGYWQRHQVMRGQAS